MANEHNAIAAKLAAAYQQMTDQELFDKARMINAGVMAKIHTLEWTPAILPNKNLAAAMRSNWAGAISMLSPMEAEAVNGLADTFFPHDKDGVFGFRKGPRIDWGTKFSMTEVRVWAAVMLRGLSCSWRVQEFNSSPSSFSAVERRPSITW
jgi:hypothetical protein